MSIRELILVNLLVNTVYSLWLASKNVGKDDKTYEKAFQQICAMEDN